MPKHSLRRALTRSYLYPDGHKRPRAHPRIRKRLPLGLIPLDNRNLQRTAPRTRRPGASSLGGDRPRVAVDHIWAAQHRLPASMSLPSNSSKGVYILDAYHQIHCLTIIRRTLREILETGHPPPSIPLQHAWHCFDSLLQYLVCGNSGDTLLYTWGRNQTGDGQARKCVDWRERKEWIRRRTACYRDTEAPVRLVDHFTGCEDGDEAGDDGIRLDLW
ncbi:uncharacterized protein BO66DRAFT_45067 [Aspergillus aculeatinus CBS 121060]|uniref:Uncharacterized protein n=1 Tax=Aspergillus aculeatinus CBS 121060 TaxID=1448322 RepID=A0ACD1HF63_9EURO|nr:hypothetical protein BO66DRAFT_45067 [Aspergillus aculeatinus CBS 121060]RAH72011.1 hypothetical protein BO66DRAFT_45067 [Aspergillus aculeatinus CBS 121060]